MVLMEGGVMVDDVVQPRCFVFMILFVPCLFMPTFRDC